VNSFLTAHQHNVDCWPFSAMPVYVKPVTVGERSRVVEDHDAGVECGEGPSPQWGEFWEGM